MPYRILYPSILVFMAIGVYSLSNSPFDVLLMAIFGILGVVFVKLECEPAPLILGFILGPMMEENLRRALVLSRGDPMVLFTKPISAGFLIAAIILLGIVLAPNIRKKREEVFRGRLTGGAHISETRFAHREGKRSTRMAYYLISLWRSERSWKQ